MAGLSRMRVVAPQPERSLRRCLGLLASRAYGSAAAALAYDYDYCYSEEDEPQRGPTPRLAPEGSKTSRGVQWVMIGEPGVKKHMFAERLAELLEVPHISMGSLVRQELHPSSSLYKQIARAVNEGKLVPEDVIFALLSRRLEEGYYRGETGFVLDGIPRTRIQAEILDQITDIDLVVNFKCPQGLAGKKNLGTRSFSCQNLLSMNDSGHYLNLQSPHEQSQPSVSALKSSWEEKLRTYEEQSKPLEDYYRSQKKLLDVQVAGAPGETWKGLLAALHLQDANVVCSSRKLTAPFRAA